MRDELFDGIENSRAAEERAGPEFAGVGGDVARRHMERAINSLDGSCLATARRPATRVKNEDFVNAANSLERALACLDQAVIDGQVRLRHHRWEAHEILGNLYWHLQKYPECYGHYLKTIETGKPEQSSGWPQMLNSVCALAIELGDTERIEPLLDRLLAHPQAPLGMFFFQLNRVAQSAGIEAARKMLVDGRNRCQRMAQDAEYAAAAARLGVS